MKHLQKIGRMVMATALVTLAGAPSASATTLEVGGSPKNESVEITASLESGTSAILSLTGGGLANTCTSSHLNGATASPFTGTKVTGAISALSFSSCTRPVTVHKPGKLYVEWIPGTTDGTVSSEEAEVTVGSPIGNLNCKTGEGVDIGTLTGKASGQATMDIAAVLNCGFLAPTANWNASYVVTSPEGLGVTDAELPLTTLEVGGSPKNESVEITASLESGTSAILSLTGGGLANTCTSSHLNGATASPFTGTKVTGAISALSFSSCTRPVTVHKPGKLYVEWIPGTTDGTVSSEEAEVTVGSPIGNLNCKTGEGVDIGTLTGKASGQATMDIAAVLNCGFLAPTANWNASYVVTSPEGLGVTDAELPLTTLEVGGSPKNESVEITASLESGTSAILSLTGGGLANTCTSSHLNGATASPFTGTKVTGAISALSFSSCTRPVTVHKPGKLYVEWIPGTTDGTVSSEEAEVTVGSPIGNLNCKTGEGVDIGTLTGKASGQATMDIAAVLNCGLLAPTANWNASYVVTSPEGLGVTDAELPLTTLEVGGSPKNESVEITASLESGTSAILSLTGGGLANTCTSSHLNGATASPFTGTKVTGAISALSFSSCTRPVTVHKPGKLYVEWIPGTTDGTVSSEEAEVTVGSPIGNLNCKTGEGVDIGTLTGKASGQATMDIAAVLNCGLLAPTANWNASYVVTSPEGLGVTA